MFGLFGSNWTGVNQFRRSAVVASMKSATVSPPSVERKQFPYWKQANTLFTLVGLIRFSSPSPPTYSLNPSPPQDRSEPLSWAPPETLVTSCGLIAAL